MLFFIFCLFPLSKFQMTIVKNLKMEFEGSYEVLLPHKYFWSTHFWQWNDGTFNFFFGICTEMNFVSLFFLSEINIATSLLMIHLKCTIVHYANLNSSSVSKPFVNYGPLNMLFLLFMFILTRIFSKPFEKRLSFFNTNFNNSFQDVLCYRILGCQTLWYYIGGTLNMRQNLKKYLLLTSKIGIFEIFFKKLCEESFEDLEINSN